MTSRLPGFYNLTLEERLQALGRQGVLTQQELAALKGDAGLAPAQADHMIENVIGVFGLPLGIALNFVVNGREVLVPMAVEEPSIVAGASFMARLARSAGGFHAETDPPEMIGQIQVLDLGDVHAARQALLDEEASLLAEAARVDPLLQKLGGGPRQLEIRIIENSPIGAFLVVHLIYDVRDAMGANAVNTACERIAARIEALTGGRVHLRILSNLADRRLARARCVIPLAELAFGGGEGRKSGAETRHTGSDGYAGETVRDGILSAWAFAAADPYRAATHNKGIMNGIDPILIATGNDWRAVEAGAHAYAARSGRYTSLSTWGKDEDGNLTGMLEMPLAVGIVGGATKVHPAARAALKLMGVKTAADLAEIAVSVGLAQNLAALRALSTEGIQRGHMSLHARQVAVAAGAQGSEIERLARQLAEESCVRVDRAEEILAQWKGTSV